MKARLALRAAPLLAVFPLLLVGCSSGTSSSDSSSAPAAADQSSAAAPSEAAPSEAASSDVPAGKVAIDVGLDEPVLVEGPPRIAFLDAYGLNEIGKARPAAALEEAKRLGIEMDVFDAAGDVATQTEQIQNAIASGRYNAFIVVALDVHGSCKLLTEDAPAAGIVVVYHTTAPCEHDLSPSDDLWQPGSLSYIGGNGGPIDGYTEWAERVKEELLATGKPQKVAFMSGPQVHAAAVASAAAVEKVFADVPGIEYLGTMYGEYTQEAGLTNTENFLLAHPDMTAIMTGYTENSAGAAQAIRKAGKTPGKDILVYDVGGSKQAVDLVKSGDITLSRGLFPASTSILAVNQIVEAFKTGQVPPRITLNDGKTPTDDDWLTAENVDTFTPEY